MTTTQEQTGAAPIQQLIEKRDEYVTRLDTGFNKIEEARGRGQDVGKWEKFWIEMLHEYEEVCNQLAELQPA